MDFEEQNRLREVWEDTLESGSWVGVSDADRLEILRLNEWASCEITRTIRGVEAAKKTKSWDGVWEGDYSIINRLQLPPKLRKSLGVELQKQAEAARVRRAETEARVMQRLIEGGKQIRENRTRAHVKKLLKNQPEIEI